MTLFRPFAPWKSLWPGLLVGLGHLSPVWTFVFVPVGLSWFLYQSDAPEARNRPAFAWFFAFGYFLVSLYWVTVSMVIDVAHYFWLMPIVFFGFPAFLALFFWIPTKLLPWQRTQGLTKVFCGSLVWLLFEVLRGHMFTGFPWPLLGYSFSFCTPLNQVVFLTTIFGLSLLTFWLSALPYVVMRCARFKAWGYGLALGLILGGTYGWGSYHISTTPMKPLPPLRLVQGNIPQSVKWVPALQAHNLKTLMTLSVTKPLEPRTLVIWPETAVTYAMTPAVRQRLAMIIPKGGYLLTGGPRYEPQGDTYRVWNSLYVLDDQGEVVGLYDKAHLVPFGEYIPGRALWDRWFPGLVDRLGGRGAAFEHGPGRKTLEVVGVIPFTPLICYEVIFPGQVVAGGGVKPGWILNITNDAWFHNTAGPYQHLESARFRAIEENLPLVRVANNGISAIIDQFGRILKTLSYNTQGTLEI